MLESQVCPGRAFTCALFRRKSTVAGDSDLSKSALALRDTGITLVTSVVSALRFSDHNYF